MIFSVAKASASLTACEDVFVASCAAMLLPLTITCCTSDSTGQKSHPICQQLPHKQCAAQSIHCAKVGARKP